MQTMMPPMTNNQVVLIINVQLHDSRKNDATENQFGDVKAVIPELLEQQVLLFLA